MNIQDKKNFRKVALARRNALSEKEIVEKSLKILTRLKAMEEFNEAKAIMAYMSFRSEVMTDDILRYALSMGKRIVIPITVKGSRQLTLSEITNLDSDFELDFYGIRIPKKDRIRSVIPQVIDLVLVPGVAFSETKYRMGYGAGYYDSFIETLRQDTLTLGLAFEEQIYESIPVEPHDKQMDFILTENRLF